MITLDMARAIARDHVQSMGVNLTLLAKPISSGDYGWVFSYQSKAFLETGHPSVAVAGNAPLLIDREQGHVITLGTAEALGVYLENYVRFGDPHAVPGSSLELSGWHAGADKVAATKALKAHTQLGLKDAKATIDMCLAGQKPVVNCAAPETAEILVGKLVELGFKAKQLAQ